MSAPRLLGFILLLSLAQFVQSHDVPQTQPVPRHDTSLTVTEYTEMGMPPPEKVWGKAEYNQAEAVIARLAERNPMELPLLDSQKSGALFARMIARENVEVANRKELPLSDRLTKSPTARLGYVLNEYTNAEKKGGTNYRREVVSLEGYSLFDGILGFANEVEVKKAPKVIANARLAAEVDDYIGAIRTTLTMQAESILMETTAPRNDLITRQIAIDSLCENLPKLDAILLADQKAAIRKGIDQLGEAESDRTWKLKILALKELLP